MRSAAFVLIALLASGGAALRANPYDGSEIIDLAKEYYVNREYYSAVTECMRYGSYYPDGDMLAESRLLMAKSYYMGNNYGKASSLFEDIASAYSGRPEGGEALYRISKMRLLSGSPFFAMRGYSGYISLYGGGEFSETVYYERCAAAALAGDYRRAFLYMNEYRSAYPEGIYSSGVQNLNNEIMEEMNRPKKSASAALIGSIVLPGFGFFYTGDYVTGAASFVSNVLMISLSCYGFSTGNNFEGFLFGMMGLSFYQYSLYGGLREVEKYNSPERLNRRIRLGLKKEF